MKTYSEIFLIFLCILIIFTAGCTSQKVSPASTPEPTPQPVRSRNTSTSHTRTTHDHSSGNNKIPLPKIKSDKCIRN